MLANAAPDQPAVPDWLAYIAEPRHAWPILLIFGVALYLVNLGGYPLYTKGEPREAVTVFDIVHGGGVILPQRAGVEIPSKPLLMHWMAALVSIVAGGVNEFSVRLPSAGLAIAGVIVCYFYVRRLFDDVTALFAALILATTFQYLQAGTGARVDMTLTFFMEVAFFEFILMAEGLTRRRMLLYVAIALAVLTKGPIGLILPGSRRADLDCRRRTMGLHPRNESGSRNARRPDTCRRMVPGGVDRRRPGIFPQAGSHGERAPLRRRRRFPRGPHPSLLLYGTRSARRLHAVDDAAAYSRRRGLARAAQTRSAPQIYFHLVRRRLDFLQPPAEQTRRVPALPVSRARHHRRDLSPPGPRASRNGALLRPLARASLRFRDAAARQRRPGCAGDAGRVARPVRRPAASGKHSARRISRAFCLRRSESTGCWRWRCRWRWSSWACG